VQTCKHLQINPFVYLREVIERVSIDPARLVLELTAREWKRLRLNFGAQSPKPRVAYNKAAPLAGFVDPKILMLMFTTTGVSAPSASHIPSDLSIFSSELPGNHAVMAMNLKIG
jgi:hypothetical protein